MNIYLAKGVNTMELILVDIPNIEIIIMGEFLDKHGLDILEDKPKKILDLFSLELNTKETDVLLRYSSITIEQIIYLSNKLQENNHRLHTVFIPSQERLLIGKEEELEFTRKHANWASFSASQIEEGYQEWIKIYEELKQELPKYAIKVKEV